MDAWGFLAVFATVGSVVLFSTVAALAFSWAVKDGQFRNLNRGARSIFDADEPIGEPTDAAIIDRMPRHDDLDEYFDFEPAADRAPRRD